jgi:hypothetical protein
MRTYLTGTGTITARPLGEYRTDLHYRNDEGRTVATVVMAKGDAERLLSELTPA